MIKKSNMRSVIELIKDQDVKTLAMQKFQFDLSKGQEDIVRKIAFRLHKRISISAMTRYGKTQCVAIAISLLIQFERNIKVMFVGPMKEQAGIIKRYMNELIMLDPDMFKLIPTSTRSTMDMNVEKSQKRLTFLNGCEYEVFSAYHEANSLMGWGAGKKGIIIIDEACLVSSSAYAKIMRMIGDDPENIMLIELYNPWDKATKAYEHTEKSEYDVTHIGYDQAIKEGRTTKAHVEEMREDMTDLEFTVLMKSRFPDEADDALFNLAKIKIAEMKETNLFGEMLDNVDIIINATKHTESEVLAAKENLLEFKIIISCDPADKGRDKTVMYWGVQKGFFYEVMGVYSEDKSDPMKIVGKMFNLLYEKFGPCIGLVMAFFKYDVIGIGTGPVSRTNELIKKKKLKNVKVISCHHGESAYNKREKKQISLGKLKKEFSNKKAKFFFKLRDVFRYELINIPADKRIRKHLVAMKWELTSSASKRIIDPKEYSPDFADGLEYFCWEEPGVTFGFLHAKKPSV